MRIVSSLLLTLTGILLILIPRFIFPTCGFSPQADPVHGARMICNVTGLMSQGAGAATLLAAGVLSLAKGRPLRAVSLALAGVAALFVLFVFTLWPGVCKSATMSCRVGTRPAALLVAGGQLVAVAMGFWAVRRKEGSGVR